MRPQPSSSDSRTEFARCQSLKDLLCAGLEQQGGWSWGGQTRAAGCGNARASRGRDASTSPDQSVHDAEAVAAPLHKMSGRRQDGILARICITHYSSLRPSFDASVFALHPDGSCGCSWRGARREQHSVCPGHVIQSRNRIKQLNM